MYRYPVLGVVGWALCVAISAPCSAQEGPNLPEGVTHVSLPPGALELERIVKKGKVLLRLSVGKTVIEARTLFLGDGKGALQVEATKEGIHWPSARGAKGFVIDGVETHEPGSTIGVRGGHHLTVDNLKPGSVYVTTPSVKFDFGPGVKGKPRARAGQRSCPVSTA